MDRERAENTETFRPADADADVGDTRRVDRMPNAAADAPTGGFADAGGGMYDAPETTTLEQVREGMKVIDAAGDEIGKVEYVMMGDPGAAEVEMPSDTDGGLVEDAARAFGGRAEPKVAPTIQARLLRLGHFKVDGKGWIDTDRYVVADQIAQASSDTVRLSVTKEDLAEEA